jgi:hypothetical protein
LIRSQIPLYSKVIIVLLFLLALGGLIGAINFLSDPSGAAMGMSSELARLPVADYRLPGLFLLIVMCICPLFLRYGMLRQPRWDLGARLTAWSKSYWAWAGRLILGIVLALWPGLQAVYIGFGTPSQWFTAFLDVMILLLSLLPPVRRFFAEPC